MSPGAAKGRKAAARRAPRGYRKLLYWAALPVTDRRWAAPLSALALGFGLFVGVAIGPGASGTFATSATQLLEIPEIPGLTGGTDTGGGEGEAGGSSSSAGNSAGVESGGGGSAFAATESSLPSFASAESESSESAGGEATEAPEPSPPKESTPPAESEPEAEEETLTGVVVHVNPAAGSYAIADAAGTLSAIHAPKLPRAGLRVSVPTRLLANGTFAEAGPRKRLSERKRVSFSGVVTSVDSTPATPAYTVSKRGVSLLIRVHPDPSGIAPTLPALGAFAKVTADIENPPAAASAVPPATTSTAPPVEPAVAPVPAATASEAVPATEPTPAAPPSCAPDPAQPPLPAFAPGAILWQKEASAEGAPFTYGDFAGIVEAVCPDSSQLLISADDTREGLRDLLFTVPAGIDAKKVKVGESVLATANIGTDGSLTLTGLASDERTKGAENLKAAQGDLAPSKLK